MVLDGGRITFNGVVIAERTNMSWQDTYTTTESGTLVLNVFANCNSSTTSGAQGSAEIMSIVDANTGVEIPFE